MEKQSQKKDATIQNYETDLNYYERLKPSIFTSDGTTVTGTHEVWTVYSWPS